MRRTVSRRCGLGIAMVSIFLLCSIGCVQKKRIYSEPARYDHGQAAVRSAPAQPGSAQAGTEQAGPVESGTVVSSELDEKAPQVETASADESAAAATAADLDAGGETMTGLASWIADDFHGLRTASGELYDKDQLTAAHRTLPMNTRVEVTNLENDRFTVVRINDRGPFKKNRVIDVSRRAAEELGMVAKGLVRVRLRVLDGQGAPTGLDGSDGQGETPAAEVVSATGVAAPPAQASGDWYVQVGAFQDRDNAKKVLTGLYARGYAESRISRDETDGLYRVQAGSFQSRAEADAALGVIRQDHPAGYVIRSD